MRSFIWLWLFAFILSSATAQEEDGYLSEYGSNSSSVIATNGIVRETVCNYTFKNSTYGVNVLTDMNRVILTDSVTIYYDTLGRMSKRVRDMKKMKSVLYDTFYYNKEGLLSEIATTTVVNDIEFDIGYSLYQYNERGRVLQVNCSYSLSNGLTKNGVVDSRYNGVGRLFEVWHQSNLSGPVLYEQYWYDRKGKVSQIDNLDHHYSLLFKHRRRKILVYSTNPLSFYRKTEMTYNKLGFMVKKKFGERTDQYFYNPDGTLSVSKSNYYDRVVPLWHENYDSKAHEYENGVLMSSASPEKPKSEVSRKRWWKHNNSEIISVTQHQYFKQ